MTQLAPFSRVTHLMTMSNEEILIPNHRAIREDLPRAIFGGAQARGPIIDQEGREIPEESPGRSSSGLPLRFRQFAPIRSAI